MTDSISGLGYLLNGFRLIFQPGLRRFVLIPFLINTIVFILLFMVSLHYFMFYTNKLLSGDSQVWHYIAILLWILFSVVYLVFSAYTFLAVANIIIAPFNSVLAERVAARLTNSTSALSNTNFWRLAVHSMSRQAKIIFYYLLWLILIGVTLFIPILHYATAVIWVLFTGWFLALTYLDYPSDNAGISLPQLRMWMRDRYGLVLSFGLSILMLSFVPIVNFIVIPAAVAGAVNMWVKENANLRKIT